MIDWDSIQLGVYLDEKEGYGLRFKRVAYVSWTRDGTRAGGGRINRLTDWRKTQAEQGGNKCSRHGLLFAMQLATRDG